MKIKCEPVFACGDRYEVKMQVAQGGKWIDFGFMNYTERKELAEQLRSMAAELLKVK